MSNLLLEKDKLSSMLGMTYKKITAMRVLDLKIIRHGIPNYCKSCKDLNCIESEKIFRLQFLTVFPNLNSHFAHRRHHQRGKILRFLVTSSGEVHKTRVCKKILVSRAVL